MKRAVTFGVQYRPGGMTHPVDERLTCANYVVFEGADEFEIRHRIVEALDIYWSFDYDWDDFQEQIETWGYTEVKL